ncbi:hypothetical protein COCOR_02852 [Corallococcus coralloides DSM 2259]|uniref:Uncharacterized protein n=1 Tax=Corallococcus coralloides (strain ATCC 25202 / DSM 2259 / NBRC 100086 / M2) TaxID=1144275 RepID=H8MX60_CORCM|nr:hypothetical protein [Corallococcus coralloides]AFE04868.1 hypothetical protein COCOR_02852 [Corallococcus coralloides DSM 2259]
MRIDLDTAFLDDGIRSTNFFNGRLLSAEDLTQEQTARDAALQRMGRALGEGVAYGLEVTPSQDNTVSTPLVTVRPGLAVNREGQTLKLLQPVEVALLPMAPGGISAAPTAEGRFKACSPPGSVYVSGTGVYLLVLSPAAGREGRAVVSGLGGVQSGCDAKLRVEGVLFRLLKLDVSNSDLLDEKKLRNRVAHQCFGTTTRAQMLLDWPFREPEAGYGLIDKLRPGFLTPCDVPLAVLHWKDGEGIRFVDLWSARRPLARVAHPVPWLGGQGERRTIEAQALFLQFQEHIEKLRLEPSLPGIPAKDHFDWLPPVGVLPLGGFAGTHGLDYLKFFEGLTTRPPVNIEGARLGPLLRAALDYPPVSTGTGELLWLYWVRENQQAVVDSPATSRPQPYLVFASGHIPYWGDARFSVAKWRFANFSSGGPNADQPGP